MTWTPTGLTAAVQAVLDRHDALRLRLTVPVPRPVGHRGAAGGAVRAADVLTTVDAGHGTDWDAVIAEQVAFARTRLAPEQGCVVQAVHLRRGRLLFLVHHLAVDGVSWRIIVPDLAHAYQGAALDPVGHVTAPLGRHAGAPGQDQ